MNESQATKFWIVIVAIFIIFITAACGQIPEQGTAQTLPEGAVPIDPIFVDFYNHMGGYQVLGYGISPIFSHGNRKFQYVEAGCLEFHVDAPASQAYQLSPLGLEMALHSSPVPPPPEDSDVLYVNQHTIRGKFAELYEQMGGARFVGKPLTELHYNYNKQRYEQYFENLGFYRMENEPLDAVHLLAYGAWKCDVYCRKDAPLVASVELLSGAAVLSDSPFTDAYYRLGEEFTGFPLTPPQRMDDGTIQQVFEHVVFAAPAENLTRVYLLPLPGLLGVKADPIVPEENVSWKTFISLDGDLGHNVPHVFMDYITLHGGMEIAGSPITELVVIKDDIFRQCFTNYCLEYHAGSNVPDEKRLRLQALGYAYRNLHPTTAISFDDTQSLKALSVQVWEQYPLAGPDQHQEISVGVYEGHDPLPNIEPILLVSLPDGSQASYRFPPTGLNGHTYLRIEPIQAPHGTLITYRVCISSLTDEVFCVREGYVIWFAP
jgi:hypothetical protein